MKSKILGGYGNQHLWGLGRWAQNDAIEMIIKVFIYSICLGLWPSRCDIHLEIYFKNLKYNIFHKIYIIDIKK
jgi:hypothetical protein